jgi:hypothetical protein
MGNNERKSSRGPPPISPDQLSQLASRLFNPNLKPPRVHYAPTPPSLSMSRLQPHAEIDERPYYRVRRFRTWNNAAPPVRLALLDPRRRGELFFPPMMVPYYAAVELILVRRAFASISNFRHTKHRDHHPRTICDSVRPLSASEAKSLDCETSRFASLAHPGTGDAQNQANAD